MMNLIARSLAAAVLALLCLGIIPAQARGSVERGVGPNQVIRTVRFPGQVTALAGPVGSPTSFTLQTRERSIDFRILPRTVFQARTAEAQVDGFAQYDFAVVTATRLNGDWRVARVLYDVVPFGPIREFTVSGRVVTVDARARNVQLKLMSGDTHWVRLNLNTRYELNGTPMDPAPALTKDALVVVTVHRNDAGVWVAALVNLKA